MERRVGRSGGGDRAHDAHWDGHPENHHQRQGDVAETAPAGADVVLAEESTDDEPERERSAEDADGRRGEEVAVSNGAGASRNREGTHIDRAVHALDRLGS